MPDNQESIAAALVGVIEPGDSWVVRGISNDVLVEPYSVSEHNVGSGFSTDLELKLDVIDAQISSTGGATGLFLMFAVVIACLGIHLNWFAGWLGDALPYVQSFWFYATAIVLMFFVNVALSRRSESVVYRRLRPALIEQIRLDGSTLSQVYVRLKEDDELVSLTKLIREDTDLENSNDMKPF